MIQAVATKVDSDRIQWLEDRKEYLGGTDIAAIMGFSSYRTPVDVWEEKTGKKEIDLSDNNLQWWGRELEDAIARKFTVDKGQEVQKRNYPIPHKQYSFIRSNIDRKIVGVRAGLECKSTVSFLPIGKEFGDEETDQIPIPYLIQCHSYLTTTDYDHWRLAALFTDKRESKYYWINPNKQLSEMIIENCVNFWNTHVLADIPPEPKTLDDLKKIYREVEKGSSIEADDKILEYYNELKTLKKQKKDIEDKIKAHSFDVQKYMGNNEILINPETAKPLFTWKKSNRTSFQANIIKEKRPTFYEKLCKTTTGRTFLTK